MTNHVQTVSQCKVCTSVFRNRIEQLHLNGLSPEKIYDYLQNLSEPNEKNSVISEDIKPSSIRRHMQRHFNSEEGAKVKLAETKARVEQSRTMLNQGVSIFIDKVNNLSHLIEVAMIRLEEVEHTSNESKKHQFTISYMNTIKGLIESLSKLTGELRQEGTIDINFFNNEIASFADIVLTTIRLVDKQLNLYGELETEFAKEFSKQWQDYQERQMRAIAGTATPNTVNTFNEIT
ncbi:hypothetical protein D3C75_420320 [compost metagenome]